MPVVRQCMLEVIDAHAANHPYLQGKWQVSACDILERLQNTNGWIMGPGAALLQRSQQLDLVRNFKPLECARDHAKAKKKAAVDDDDVDWLQMLASEHFGHEDLQRFQHTHHWVLQNADIIVLWQFAARFCETYHRKKSGRSGNSITKMHICIVLNVGETWLRQAEGHHLVQWYGEGGECETQEVKEKLVETHEHPMGSRKLFAFLHDWAVSHCGV
ncbi:hypothetical protein L208DRAFT_1536578 [Tricholoma matsutake]|nr:hypothetical protein L208DRAFT_1536578 [Tricholoma matsutake 945]